MKENMGREEKLSFNVFIFNPALQQSLLILNFARHILEYIGTKIQDYFLLLKSEIILKIRHNLLFVRTMGY